MYYSEATVCAKLFIWQPSVLLMLRDMLDSDYNLSVSDSVFQVSSCNSRVVQRASMASESIP